MVIFGLIFSFFAKVISVLLKRLFSFLTDLYPNGAILNVNIKIFRMLINLRYIILEFKNKSSLNLFVYSIRE